MKREHLDCVHGKYMSFIELGDGAGKEYGKHKECMLIIIMDISMHDASS